MHRLLPVLFLLACAKPPCGESTYGGGELTVSFDGALGGSVSQAGITEPGGTGSSMTVPEDTSQWVTVLAAMGAPDWDLFPNATDAVLEVELKLGREPQRAEIIRVEWIDPAGPRQHLAVRDVPVFTWSETHAGSLVFADMPWETCPNDVCEDVAQGTTTVTWSFDATPVSSDETCP
ncbi:MAG: hypothetical protein KC912_13630 [Proteobacteria bacterium]|nr:hypothetical protein [Pseudomonadota bacterium]